VGEAEYLVQHIVGFRCTAKDLVGDREQQRTQKREALGVHVARRGHHDRLIMRGTKMPTSLSGLRIA
jgi:hypothetical protein